VDIDEAKIKGLQAGKVSIYEPTLEDLFERNTKEGRLGFSTDLRQSTKDAEIIFLALPTPPGEDGSADLNYVLGAAEKLGPLLKSYTVIVIKSTVPVGTAEKVRAKVKLKVKTDFDVVSNPEFLREGFAVSDFMKPDRIVVGTRSQKASKIMEELYAPFVRQGNPIYFMDERSAEMTKYAANSFLAMKISFMNEIANLCELTAADVDAIRLGIGADERIGKRFLFPGIGYGGSCFPKDVQALQKTAQEYNYDFKILKAVNEVNSLQKKVLFNKLKKYFKGNIANKTFALWGLAFKPNTDDMREAPAMEIIKLLLEAGAKIQAFDPEAEDNARRYYSGQKNITIYDHHYDVLKHADALLIATEWPVFRSPDFDKMKKLLKSPVIFDGRNLYNSEEVEKLGFHYESIGRPIMSNGGSGNG
jgi:UDPglucose 6-dehydrogenase